MKKLLLLLLVFTGMVSTASAWTNAYIKHWVNSVETNTQCQKISDNNFRIAISSDYFDAGDFYFRFTVDGTEYGVWKPGQGDWNDYQLSAGAGYGAATGDNMMNSKSFKILASENTDNVVIISLDYNTSDTKWYVSYYKRSATTFDVRFVKPSGWTGVKLYAYDSDGVPLCGVWSGSNMTDNEDGTYSFALKAPENEDTKVNKLIFNDGGSNKYPSEGGWEVVTGVYNSSGVVTSQTVTVSKYGMSTICSEYPLDFSTATPSGLRAYRITGSNKETGVLTKEIVTKVPAGVGVYIEGASGDTSTDYTVSPTATATSIGDNMLVGVTSETKIYQIDGSNTNYILTVNKVDGTADTPKFFKVYDDGDATLNEAEDDGNTVPAGKAYLQIPTAMAAHEFFWFDDDMTGIEKVSVDTKALNGAVYNLAGQRVAQPTKGLYIVNGKKVVLK